ncbi:hypothetical protein M9H77_21633 [Catharanthus roseus]|uniref:Uncharacterized protein n=1 Tax=Catharanthus roseus TaxID=4058 RepID=A0ACC0APL5_CATRO|nr:hypothetical protein M9H77_21633 [Catharanthus roseus]
MSCFIYEKKVQNATVGSHRDDADRRHVDQNVVAKLTEMVKDEEVATRFTYEVLHFGVETTNCAESEYSVLKLWLSMCHCDLDTVFLNIDSVIEKISKLKEKFNAKSNPILKNISNNISHLALNKILFEVKSAREIFDDSQNKCRHYLRKSHGIPCACELVGQYKHFLPLQLEDVSVFWRTLEIGVDVSTAHARDMDSEMRDLASMLD